MQRPRLCVMLPSCTIRRCKSRSLDVISRQLTSRLQGSRRLNRRFKESRPEAPGSANEAPPGQCHVAGCAGYSAAVLRREGWESQEIGNVCINGKWRRVTTRAALIRRRPSLFAHPPTSQQRAVRADGG